MVVRAAGLGAGAPERLSSLAAAAASSRALLFRNYWRLERRLAPGLRSSQYVFAERLADAMPDRPTWLDLGCGRRPFPDWMPEDQARVLAAAGRVVGIDPDVDSLRDHRAYPQKLAATAEALPFPAATFDVASANMVVEHLANPAATLAEIRRVLKPGGRLLFHTPNRRHWPLWLAARVPEPVKLGFVEFLEDRRPEDVFSTYYRLNDARTIGETARAVGFAVERLDFVSTSAVTVMLGPLVVPELLWIRMLRRPRLAWLRSNIIAVLKKT